MHRLSLLALVLAGLATLWLAAPAFARVPAQMSPVVAQICVDAGDIAVNGGDALSGKPQLLKACAGQKNRLAIPCQGDRCLPVEPLSLAFVPPPRHFPPGAAVTLDERPDPDGQFRPPRLAA